MPRCSPQPLISADDDDDDGDDGDGGDDVDYGDDGDDGNYHDEFSNRNELIKPDEKPSLWWWQL